MRDDKGSICASESAVHWRPPTPAGSRIFNSEASGERQIGSWQAGSVEDGLEHFGRRFDDLATEAVTALRRGQEEAGWDAEACRVLEQLAAAATRRTR